MGVPKFYRWISERYPCLSEVVKEFQLPEFDNLYLDMNGIIHVCSHPDDENPHFRTTEEKIFKDICHYIDFLFRMIKPRKVFYMAVDGVAPRAKMNQQRGRRFRSAREAELLIKKAEEKGEVLPTEKRFDSNCITPGTPFMVKLQEHLKYFVVDKITNDPIWQGPKIYLSGHETPGEGEHKVMDFIRYSKSHADYDPDTRHCLYGLDADLIMLGLTSHDPHFSLLREEVRFGGKKDKNKRPVTPEETTFHLLHLSLMRDYLAYEFDPLKDKLPFPWDLEKIIDDWILMGFLVGNDFIPHLPHLHIHHDALPLLWKTYMNVLPTLDGYINEGGHLNLPRFEKYFEELSKFDVETFESAFSDLKVLESKLGGKSINESAGASRKWGKMKKLQKFKVKKNGNPFCALEDESANNAAQSDEDDDDDDDSDEDDSEEDEDEEDEEEDEDEEDYDTVGDEFQLHKRDYYMSKMEFSEVTPDVLKNQAHGYVKAIQWILLYYFEGCPSWSWFYPHHYAPYISDVKGFSDMKITFELSEPFLPFQQLMAVLPAASKDLLPPALQALMTETGSPVLDFYPVNFETDLNGKQQDWEAVVLIPFIDEQRLLQAMSSKDHLLTNEEKSRNRHGPHLMYEYTAENVGFFPSPMPAAFPDIHCSRAKLTELHKDLFRIDANKLRKGLLDTFRLNVYFPGFPVLRFLPHTHELKKANVKVFQHNSRGHNMVLCVEAKENLRLEEVADDLLGQVTHVGWPHLHEAKVIAVANESFKIELLEEETTVKGKKTQHVSYNRRKLDQNESTIVARDANAIKDRHMDRFAIDVGKTEIILYARPMTGRTYTFGSVGAITLEKQFAGSEVAFLHQMTVKDLEVEESGLTTFQTMEEVFPEGSSVFMVGTPHYGAQGKVIGVLPDQARVRIALDVKQEPDFRQLMFSGGARDKYFDSYTAAQQIGIDSHILSRITGSVFVEKSSGGRVNVGLNLKFTKRREEVPGYTKKFEKGWKYSYKCVKTVEEYINNFPDLWLTVQQQESNQDVYAEGKLFPEGNTTKLADVLKYLEDLPSTKAPKMKFGAEILDEEQVKDIEDMTAGLNPVPDTVKMKVKPRLLFRPLSNQGTLVPDPGTTFYLYDRVIVVKAGYSVPFGKRGTITGIPSEEDEKISPNTLYDVVFDEPFAGGITLRCSANKGYRVAGSAMLNLTFGEFRKNRPESQQRFRPGGRAQYEGSHGNSNGGPFQPSYNNNNLAGGRQGYNDRGGQYNDRAAMWRQQQQQHHGHQQMPQHLQNKPVQWNRGQPMFGQVFGQQGVGRGGGGGGVSQPAFVTPKVQGSTAMSFNRSLSQENRAKADNSEFDCLWKNLESHKNAKQGNMPADSSLKQAAFALPTQQPGASPRSSQGQMQNQVKTSVAGQSGTQMPPAIQLLSKPNIVPSHPAGLLPNPQNTPGQPGSNVPLYGDGLMPTPSGLLPQPKVLAGFTSSPKQTGADTTVPIVQSLFASASKNQNVAGPENAEFLAMFNSLKTQSEEAKQGKVGIGGNQGPGTTSAPGASALSSTSETKSADLTLKQLLKIGVETSPSPDNAPLAAPIPLMSGQLSPRGQAQTQPDSTTQSQSGKSQSTTYGRQVSLQELFKEADRQQKQQSAKVLQQPQTAQPAHVRPDIASGENRDPIAELESYCKTHIPQGNPTFDYKPQHKQMAYIANVILPNGQRYEGSLCRTKEEAAKSAASMAILCLNQKPNPVIPGYLAGAQRPNVNRFISPNSAFSPIGIPGPNPSLLPRHPPVSNPMLLTPQHFINQPPPSVPLHQLIHQHMPPPQPQQNVGSAAQNYGLEHHQRIQQIGGPQVHSPWSSHGTSSHQTGSVAATAPTAYSMSMNQTNTTPTASSATTASSVSQQFIPLQVSRNQKTPSKRKDSESEKSETASSSAADNKRHNSGESIATISATSNTGDHSKETARLSSVDLPAKQDLDSKNTSNLKEIKDKNGAVPNLPSPASLASGSVTPSDGTSKSTTPTVKSGQRKKSRLAANFGPKKS